MSKKQRAGCLVVALGCSICTAETTQKINPENGHVYIYNADNMSWDDAQAWAESLGGHLATINSLSEQVWLNESFGDMPDAWIGLQQAPGSNEPMEGWGWVTGEPLDFTFWSPSAPSPDNGDSAGDENCAVSYLQSSNGHWDDKRCARPFPSIAELPSGYSLTTFDPRDVFIGSDPAEVELLDQSVGVTGYIIEDFEDTDLISQVLISYGNQSLPQHSVQSTEIGDSYPVGVWDAHRYFLPRTRNETGVYPVDMFIPQGTASVGIGVSDLESPLELIVNDTNFGDIRQLPGFYQGEDNSRDIYLRIDAIGEKSITHIRFNPTETGESDVVLLDHLAIDPGPCVPDLNSDGALNFFDVSAFLSAFQAGCP